MYQELHSYKNVLTFLGAKKEGREAWVGLSPLTFESGGLSPPNISLVHIFIRLIYF